MLNSHSSLEIAFVSDMPAALETEVGTVFAPDAFPPGVVIFTIEPFLFFSLMEQPPVSCKLHQKALFLNLHSLFHQ